MLVLRKHVAVALIVCFSVPVIAFAAGPRNTVQNSNQGNATNYRWMGHDFVFCFVTDDGKRSNLAWADVARAMGFRYTIAINEGRIDPGNLTGSEVHQLSVDGFEIAGHSYSHGLDGLPITCAMPPRGSMGGYFLCDGIDPVQAMLDFTREIERDSVATFGQFPVSQVRTFAYPRHIHTKAIIDSLITEGYIGARMGSQWNEPAFSYGDFTTVPHNSWDGGMSLFRVPTTTTSTGLFGDHSAVPPVHYTRIQVEALVQSRINTLRQSGGAFILYDHHLGDDDDTVGDINYGFGGISRDDLRWVVELIRANGGVVMTFGDMCDYYRARSTRFVINGDYVWQPAVSPVEDVIVPAALALGNYPNPFNPRTAVSFSLEVASLVTISVFDQTGRRVKLLVQDQFAAGYHELSWNGTNQAGQLLPSGQYFLRIDAGNRSETHKMLLLK